MKCSKCGYTSFDYNQVCPKCNKDIASERDSLNLPSYRPNPPSLLGALTGEADESSVGIKGPEDTGSVEREATLGLDDSQSVEAMDVSFQDSQDLEMPFEPGLEGAEGKPSDLEELLELDPLKEGADFFKETISTDLSLDNNLEELSLDPGGSAHEDSEAGALLDEQASEDNITLDADLDIEETAVLESLELDDDTGPLESEDISLDDMEKLSDKEEILDVIDDEASLDLEGLDAVFEENVGDFDLSTKTEGDGDGGDGFSLDLESLDLDLELDEPDDNQS